MEQKQLSINDVFLQIQDAANLLRSEVIRLSTENAELKKKLTSIEDDGK